MKVGITLNEVLRDFISQFAYTYEKYHGTKFDIEKNPITDFNLLNHELVDFEDSGEPEYVFFLDFEDSGEPEYVFFLDFEDSGEPEYVFFLDFQDSGEPEFVSSGSRSYL